MDPSLLVGEKHIWSSALNNSDYKRTDWAAAKRSDKSVAPVGQDTGPNN